MSQLKIISRDKKVFCTQGISSILGVELIARVENIQYADACRDFLTSMGNYILAGGGLTLGQTAQYGYWLTKLTEGESNAEFFEYNQDATEFMPGLDFTLFAWMEQHKICNNAGSTFSPPRPDKLVVISEGVYEGEQVEGVRYPSPDHMSGWWITTNKYNGNVETLKTVHAYHLTKNRPDLLGYLAMEYGYRFESNSKKTWFDSKAI
ncbi:hypothetical protein N8I74_12745 [Chitiniphilus purpureus]|uniref:Imm33-like domain-containing protein n=1 Tax=Chitiniphilus purpureus TaxID=2981137 RepID=A0ABY6DIL5_9NEIS|nr:hypothetical protein [Chitiniphilus sp. CD1]UXY14185.1 hypothetical protein N8I74_12745 [Chitiniphilus sp. CD1]